MSAKSASDTYLDLARAMIKQARMLKIEGLKAEARALAERALDMKSMGWSLRPALVPIRVRR
jgi:hypothetical protein